MAHAKQNEVWWLLEVTDICAGCSQPYAYHAGYRCVDCDDPRCPICVQTTETMDLVCEGCFEGRRMEAAKS